ncbi:hypothetical protein GCM10010255_78610 [Streptomyces coeruleofuscus]|uniref:Uncharacterized protein n=1 Tax=Streptomyces coeruleofuscus TaxID=66879 RepID=A0ABN3J963_9ACTN
MLAALGLGSLVTIAVLLPTVRPEEEPAAYGTSPDVRRFVTVLVAGTLSATGAFTGYTYMPPHPRHPRGLTTPRCPKSCPHDLPAGQVQQRNVREF